RRGPAALIVDGIREHQAGRIIEAPRTKQHGNQTLGLIGYPLVDGLDRPVGVADEIDLLQRRAIVVLQKIEEVLLKWEALLPEQRVGDIELIAAVLAVRL